MSINHDNQLLTFAVLGGGPGGLATAAFLALSGHRVNLYANHDHVIAKIVREGGIKVEGVMNGNARVQLATADIHQAIEDTDVVIVVLPAHVQSSIAASCAKTFRDGQIILLTPGRVFGALEFRKTCDEHEMNASVSIAETQTIPFTCRRNEQGDVQMLAMKQRIKTAAYPAKDTDRVVSALGNALPMLNGATSVLETGLNSVGGILHPVPTMLNIGQVESEREQFRYYFDGISPSVARVLEQLDKERVAIGNELNIPMTSVQQWLKDVYGTDGETLYESLQNTSSYETIVGPKSIEHRYLLEDVPTGLVPLASLGNALQIPTPAIHAAINLACLICKIEFWRDGRTLKRLGLDHVVDKDDLRRVLTGA